MTQRIISISVIVIMAIIIMGSFQKCTTGKAKSEEITAHKDIHPISDMHNFIFPDSTNNNCKSCHQGIEHIRDPKSGMMQAIYTLAAKAGYKDNECIVCHGGSPTKFTAEGAHSGTIDYFKNHNGPQKFYVDPSSVWINDKTCGMCHSEQVRTQFTSIMFTESGKIQGTAWSFGGLQAYEHNVANIAVEEVEYHKRLGTDVYKDYMQKLASTEPQVFPHSMKGLPEAPSTDEIIDHPELAAYTYLRTECQRCHTGSKGKGSYGDYRGQGCGSCHIPYSNKGLYEGDDPTIDKTKSGKLLVHSIQSSRDVKVMVHGHEYSGIPTKTCTACHNRGRRIGVSYEGLMETSYSSPFMSDGDNQQKIHRKNYIHLQPDVHLTKGMVCQDCHTSIDIHSSGDLSGAIQGAVEIECQDCHGTPEMYPWELPIGYGDEIASEAPQTGAPRGVADSVPAYLHKGWIAPKKDGYLISSRGNPLTNVVRYGDEVILYSAGGKDIKYKPLKKLVKDDELSEEGKVAMVQINSHIDKLECYTCHATWAPQCYGCHVNIDYSQTTMKTDWVSAAKHQRDMERAAEGVVEYPDKPTKEEIESINNLLIAGKITEQRSYLRWEDPPMVVNGDHRISTAIPGCQTTVTVKDKNGKMRLLNHIFKIPNVEGAGAEGQLAIDIAPVNPHTTQKRARSCESCHANPKAMGYGIESGKLYGDPSKDVVMDLVDVYGNPIAANVDTVFNSIPNLKMDWSRFIDEDNNQLQTVGHHFSGSRPLNKEELGKLDRRGVCLSCHETVPDKDMASSLMSHIAKYADLTIDNKEHAKILNKSIRIAAWIQVLIPLILLLLILWWWRKRKRKSKRRVQKYK